MPGVWARGGGARRRVPRIAAQGGVARAPPSGQSAPGGGSEPTGEKGRGLPALSHQWERGGAGPGPRHVRPRTCPRGAAAGGAGAAPGTRRPGHRNSGTGTAVPAPGHRNSGTGTGHRHRDSDTGTAVPAPGQRHGKRGTGTGTAAPGHRYRHSGTGTGTPEQRHRLGKRDSGTGTAIPAPGHRHRHRVTDTGTATPAPGHRYRHRVTDGSGGTGTGTPAAAQVQPRAGSPGWVTPLELSAARGSPGGATMEPPARACSCGSPASDSGAEAGGSPRSPPKAERSRKRPGGLERAAPDSPGGKRPRKGEGGDAPPSDGDRLFAQKCRELRGFIRPLAELLEGLRRGRYDRGLSSFQQSVAMDRLQRIIGVLQKPEMGARYLGTLLQVEAMLRLWFPHVAPKPALEPAPPAAAPRRRPPAGPPGAPRCRRLPGDVPLGSLQQRGSPPCQPGPPESPPAPDV
ncbi:circadian-associated transcriptional repressor [Passer domesticus]|uniref:circadian-associated transcriptional repressor n=1 Tax=Passer domesticus TaxID=48849 RepID=UPI0030FE68DD